MALITSAGYIVTFATALVLYGSYAQELPQSCDSPIYCYGKLLDTVQLAHIFPDSKTFVDMKQKNSPNETLKLFQELLDQTGGNPNRTQVEAFVAEAFDDVSELEPHIPSDWTDHPSVLQYVVDPNYRKWITELNEIWKNLTRKMLDDVRENPDKHSLIYVPNAFVIPGGRFKEFYYWDTYWIVQGLLLCDMHETTRGVLENFLIVLEKYGHVPNGGRVYYKERSQPPMLTPMVHSYITATQNITFLRKNIKLLEKEFSFWLNERSVNVEKNGKSYRMFRYYAKSLGPRPESYSEDYYNAEAFKTEEEKTEFYINMKSAAESGWDFSSRWFIFDKKNGGNLTHIHTKDIIPVDLNAFVYWNAVLLSDFYKLLGSPETAGKYASIAEEIKTAVTAVLWNDESGTWFDYDMIDKKPRDYFYPSNLAPLWTNCYDKTKATYYADKTVDYITHEAILSYLGGIPTSLEHSNEQWDFPNAWPPLQIIAIQGLDYTGNPKAKNLAYDLANNWVKSNYMGFVKSKEMFEKYDAQHPGRYGGGGEYVVQSGFGWTNGVVIELLKAYGMTMSPTSNDIHNVRRRHA